jgi:hypothetical protein
MPKTRRILSILCLVAFLGLPLAAQSGSGPEMPLLGFLSTFWERLTAPAAAISPISALWAADETTTSDPTDPTGTTTTPPPPDTDTRGGWDPNG